MGCYIRPTSLADALDALAPGNSASGPLAILAGGTDYYPSRAGAALDDDILDITAIDELRGIEAREDHFRIGALVTWTDLIEAELPPYFDGLRAAARGVGGRQIQNAGTLCGNLCNAAPAADGVPPLLALEAEVEMAGAGGVTTCPLDGFLTGEGTTALGRERMVTAIRVPRRGPRAAARFTKLGTRRYLVISIVMVAALIEWDEDEALTLARVAVGACAPVAARLPALEGRLVGRALDGMLGAAVEAGDLAALAAGADVRTDAAYRLDAAATLLRRTLGELGGRGR